jgi:diguanylate cyclase (GGDEF)-like protein
MVKPRTSKQRKNPAVVVQGKSTSGPLATLAVMSRRPQAAPPRAETGYAPAPLAVAALAAVAAAITAVAGGQAVWLAVPLALLACACCSAPGAGALAALVTGAAAIAASLASSTAGASGAGAGADAVSAATGPARPSLALVALVIASSAAVLVVVRERLHRERSALRGFALTDPLTAIANRRSLLHRADYEIARHHRARRSFALVMIDLDGFKALNDRFGHPAGDDLLRDVAGALSHAMRGQDTVARLGGDEFCVLAPETDPGGLDRLATRVSQAVASVTAGVDAVRASVGVAVFPRDGRDVAELIEAADQRLLESKRRRGRGRRSERRAA